MVRLLLVEDDVDHAVLVKRTLGEDTGIEVVHVRAPAEHLLDEVREHTGGAP